MLLKKVIFMSILLLCFCSLSNAQQPFPVDTSRTAYADTAGTFLDRLLPESYLVFGGSVAVNTYGMQFSFPTLWIEERIRMELIAGFFWNDFKKEGFSLNPAAGARVLYYFIKQPLGGDSVNSFYAGFSGMATQLMDFTDDYTDQSQTDVVVGYSFSLSPTIQIAPEFSIGVTSHSVYRPGFGINMAVHF